MGIIISVLVVEFDDGLESHHRQHFLLWQTLLPRDTPCRHLLVGSETALLGQIGGVSEAESAVGREHTDRVGPSRTRPSADSSLLGDQRLTLSLWACLCLCSRTAWA